MKRGGPLRSDPEKARAWQQRSKPLARTKPAAPREPRPRGKRSGAASKRRRNDGPWRNEVAALRGTHCRVGGCGRRDTQCDHVWERGQGGPSVVENGTFLCEPHHTAKTENRLQYTIDMLDVDQVVWLAAQGVVWWGPDGTTYGRGRKGFADAPPNLVEQYRREAVRLGSLDGHENFGPNQGPSNEKGGTA